MSKRPLGAQISHMLKERGVEVIFGIPGVHNQEMYRGIEEAGLTHILARHEQGAGFMADGYARATGCPGVCYVITGPGVCNIMTPMGQAYSDSVPMLVISSCLDETAATRGQLHQMLDQRGAAACVCDWSQEARTAEAAYALIDRAFQECHSMRPRPKHIQVPISVLEARAAPHDSEQAAISDGSNRVENVYLENVRYMLRKAKRPLLILGGGAVSAAGSVRAFLERCPMAVFTSYAGRGIVRSDYPYLYGGFLARPDSADVVGEADLVVTVGSELAEVDLWRREVGEIALHIRVDIDTEVLASTPGIALRLKSDADAFFRQCVDAADLPNAFEWSQAEIASTRARWRAEVNAERPGIVLVAEAIRAALPPGTMIYSDMTQFAYAAKEFWDMDLPGHWHHPSGFGTLGYALPAAIGGAIARNGKPTVAIAGDYGFQYTLQELATAVELGLSLPIILWDNGKLGAIEDSMVQAQIAPNAVIQRNPDFLKLADAYGARSAEPKSLTELPDILKAAFKAGVPTLIRLTPDLAS